MTTRTYSASPEVYTARWRQVNTPELIDAVPVRISVGGPRFLPRGQAQAFAFIRELAPLGLLHVDDWLEFTERYRRRLDEHRPESIQARFDELRQLHPGQALALMGFEDLRVRGEWCHRLVFAEWWKDRTGNVIADLQHVRLGEIALDVPPQARLTAKGAR